MLAVTWNLSESSNMSGYIFFMYVSMIRLHYSTAALLIVCGLQEIQPTTATGYESSPEKKSIKLHLQLLLFRVATTVSSA